MADPLVVLSLAFALGISTSYFDGPLERYDRSFQQRVDRLEKISISRNRSAETARLRNAILKQLQPHRTRTFWFRGTAFILASMAAILAVVYEDDSSGQFWDIAPAAILFILLATILVHELMLARTASNLSTRINDLRKSLIKG